MVHYGDYKEIDKTYKPLGITAQAKVATFLFLCVCMLFSLIGTLPALGIAFGYGMYLKNGGIRYLLTGFEIFKWATLLWLVLAFLFAIIDSSSLDLEDIVDFVAYHAPLIISGLIAYLLGTYFFHDILVAHKSWIDENGLFTDKEKSHEETKQTLKISKPSSIPDEILKWNKLKEEGLITAEEFNEAKNKLLGRN